MFDLSKLLAKAGGKIGTVLTKNNTQILIGLGIGGFGVSVVSAIKATKKAQVKLEEAAEEQKTNRFNDETGHWETVSNLSRSDMIKIVAPCYIPTVVTWLGSATAIILGTRCALISKASLATAYTALSHEYLDYKRSVAETVTEDKKKQIEKRADQKTIERIESVGDLDSISAAPGDVIVYERLTGRTFSSNKDKLIKITNELNRRMRNENYISLNDLYDELGLSCTAIGYEMGWNIDKGYIDPVFGAQLDSKGHPCMTLGFEIPPQANYQNW